MATWHVLYDAPRHQSLSKTIAAVDAYSGWILGVKLHDDYPSRAIVTVAFHQYEKASRFAEANHVLSGPTRKD